MDCLCDLPSSGAPTYYCTLVNSKMTPHWCHLYQTDESYRQAWDKGRGPGQAPYPPRPKRQTIPGKPRKSCAEAKRERAEQKEYVADNAEFIESLCEACEFEDCKKTRCRRQNKCPRMEW